MTQDEIVAWFNLKRTPKFSESDIITMLSSAHPRTLFFKTLPHGAALLDLGADNGGLEVLRRWPPPARPDLRMYAYDDRKGEHFDSYDGFEVGLWDSAPPNFAAIQFDAVVCSHFIPRIRDPEPLMQWIANRLPPGGRLYLEWPSQFSTLLPKTSELAKQGVTLQVSNVYDDGVTKTIHDRVKIVSALASQRFLLEQQGYVSFPLLEEEILAHAAAGMKDSYAVQSAYWSKTKWVQYVVAVRR